MKTECPHCRQAVEVAEENINREVQCPACQKEFTASEVRLCPDCGFVNPAQAAVCRRCRYVFSRPSNRRYEPSSMFTALRRYVDFSGRSTRREYWLFALLTFLVLGVCFFLPLLTKSAEVIVSGMLLGDLFFLGVLIPSIAVAVRRLHDIGYSGWYYLLSFIPIVGPIILLIWMLFDSQPGPNRYGDNPKGVKTSEHYRFRPWIGCVGGVLIGALVILPAMVIPALSQARAAAQSIRCVNNMKQIGLALQMYAEASDGWLPPRLDNAILKQGCGEKITLPDNVFACPISEEQYVYVGAGLKADGGEGRLPILLEVPGAHSRGDAVLFLNGRVERTPMKFPTCEALAGYMVQQGRVSDDAATVEQILENARAADRELGLPRAE